MAIVATFAIQPVAGIGWVQGHVIDNDEVEPTVAIVIQKADGRAPDLLVDAAGGHLLEAALAPIKEEPSPHVFADVDIGQPVVIHVADGHAHAVAGEIESGAGADVLETPVGLLLEQPILGERRGPPF